MNIGLHFPQSGGYRQAYTNNDIEGFKGEELIDNLVREIIQNALDAKLDNCNEAVKVKFSVENICKNEYDIFKQYDVCIKGCRRFWGENADKKLLRFLNGADEIIADETIPAFIARDYNTKGLRGSRTRMLNDPWEALTNEDGVSAAKSENSGGSYGIGKNAPFACSGLSMVCYNTYSIDGNKAFTGVAKLATLLDENNREAQRIGKYQKYDIENNQYEPIYAEDECEFRDLFKRDEYGTDVIVLGFTQLDWANNVKKAVIKHFFVAIKEEKLIVEIVNEGTTACLDAARLPEIIAGYADDASMNVTMQLYYALTQPDKVVQLDILKEKDLELYVKSRADFSRTIANFRDTGMLVGLKSRRIFQHYAAVIIVRDDDLGGLLKDTEPPRHNRWDYKLITGDKDRRSKAKKCIEKIDNAVLDILKQQFEIPTEDSIDAEGVGEYLPDDVDELGGSGSGDDALNAKIKIGKVQPVKIFESTKNTPGEKAEGRPLDGDVHNHETNPDHIPPDEHVPMPVIPEEDGGKEGAKQGKGTKNITIPIMQAQRAFPVSVSQGIYKIILVPDETYENMYVRCSAVGEDGSKDVLQVKSFTHDGKSISINNNVAGPVKVVKDVSTSFYVQFESNEKLTLVLTMQEVEK